MTEREIFLNALEKEGAAARAAYLDAACAGRPALRRRVEELLRYHQEDPAFLNVPAMEQLAAAEESLAFLGPIAEPGSLGRLDHYDVLELVGRGSTGVVLRARDTKLQRVVAVKALAPRLAASAAARQRFVREAQAAAAVRDDNVVAIYAVSEDGPVPYLVMEFICGLTLEQRIRQGKRPDVTEILRIGMQVGAGLAAAHAQGLVHRDIKPANILLENGVQRVKITDFGLAHVAADAGPTGCGVLAGTPQYMSPEQARGEPTDHRTDLFSLGSVLYTLCTGRPPFQGDNTAAVLSCVRSDTPQPVRQMNPDVPEWLSSLIGRLHAKDACARPASAREVADLLGGRLALLQQPPLTPPSEAPVVPVPGARRPPRGWHSRRLLLALWLVVLLAAVAALAILLPGWQRGRSDPGPEGDPPPGESGPVEPLDLRREDIPPTLLALAGAGASAQAPPELAAVLGDGRFLLPRVGHTSWMDQSPDGQVLAVPLDEDVVLFEVATGRYCRTLKGPGGRVGYVTFSRDSRLLAATTWHEESGGAARVWDLRRNRVLFTHPQPGPMVAGAAAFSRDGKHVFTEGNGRIHVWESQTGTHLHEVMIHPRGIGQIGVSPDGRRLAVTVFFDGAVKVLAWDGKKLTEVRTLKCLSGLVAAAVYSPDGKFLAAGGEDGFQLWNARTLELVRTVETPAHQLAFAPDSHSVLAATTNSQTKPVHTFTRWDVGSKSKLAALTVEVAAEPAFACHCLSRDGKVLFLAHGGLATYVQAIDMGTAKELYPRRGHVAPLNAVAVSPDGRTAASAGEDWAVKVWDLATSRVRHTLKVHTAAVCGLAFSRDGKLLASGSRDGTIALCDVNSGRVARALLGHSRSFARIQFSPNGQALAAGGEQGVVKLWDVATGQDRSPLPGHSGAVRCVAFSPDGKLLASGGEDRTVRLHDLVNGGSRKFAVRTPVNDMAFSSDGRTLAAVVDAPAALVCLWDLETGKEKKWKGHTGHVRGAAFSPVSSLLATCGEDGTVRLWDRNAGRSGVRTIGPGPFGGGVRAVAFTPDGRYLATANANGTVYLLRVGPALSPLAPPFGGEGVRRPRRSKTPSPPAPLPRSGGEGRKKPEGFLIIALMMTTFFARFGGALCFATRECRWRPCSPPGPFSATWPRRANSTRSRRPMRPRRRRRRPRPPAPRLPAVRT
jgi:WD40 repeat protein/serine/threonine protein kinase